MVQGQGLLVGSTVAAAAVGEVPEPGGGDHPRSLRLFLGNPMIQPGLFDLVGTIVYEIDHRRYQSVFYNGTIEVVETGGFLSIESVFLVTLGAAFIGLFGLWAYGQIQRFSKKTKSMPKVEVGTRAADANMDEWLQGTAYAQSLSNKPKKKK
ncbi:translocon-associated protein subunit alpha-like isoform X2 [Phoenix dactylifera]|uniref:Translocon-associated protein subunit alpha-like isoform X2 n=1 Tax=Phoenix dactylifera TaxID=42345 RepID=A0A8B9AHR4_PHODC|nr:translocon-associated protein subunit alpha-like isoform X2 [Phoenix dactylifera]